MSVPATAESALPAAWYYDGKHYAAELGAVWYREWVCIGRIEEIPAPGDYFVAAIGTQRIVVTRDREGGLRAFHNTCRHRGSLLCSQERGRFRNGRIICPYHTWTYSTAGDLLATPGRVEAGDFRREDFSLYAVAVDTWGGFVFVNLDEAPRLTLADSLGEEGKLLANWPLADMISVQTDRKVLRCNWKIFWENYSECYHCPRVHPELCKVVEIYGRGFVDHADDPQWRPANEHDDGRARVAAGYRTWALDGGTGLPDIPGLDDDERDAGMTFASFTASMFVVGHPDYVRSVRIMPRGPEETELIVDWLLPPDVARSHRQVFDRMLELGRLVVEQDGRVCELNQAGLSSLRHRHGVLMPQEHHLADFHRWLRDRLAANAA